jgi:PTS system galactitol-specific IIA component
MAMFMDQEIMRQLEEESSESEILKIVTQFFKTESEK